MSVSVCVFICPRSCLRDHTSDLYRIFCACYFCDRGSVLLWRRRDMFCSSGFMDDVIFAHKPTLLDVAAGKSGTPDAIRLIAGGLSYKFGVPLCAWLKKIIFIFLYPISCQIMASTLQMVGKGRSTLWFKNRAPNKFLNKFNK